MMTPNTASAARWVLRCRNVITSNDPSSATLPAGRVDCNREAHAGSLQRRVSHQNNIQQMCIRAFDPGIARKPDDAA